MFTAGSWLTELTVTEQNGVAMARPVKIPEAVAEIAGHVAFYADRSEVTVENA
jgi:uncharacterized protein (DUF427 family)